MTDVQTLHDAFASAGQGQVFKYWDALDEAGRRNLLEQADEIDLDEVSRLSQELIFDENKEDAIDFGGLQPAPYTPLPAHGGDKAEWDEAVKLGEEALRAGRVAAFVVAGGQGTRLGYDGPKGTFPVTPVRNRTLFNVFADKLIGARKRYGAAIPWFIMCSHANIDATKAHFEENGYFGLGADTVHFFRQGRMPAVDLEGKIILSGKDEIAMSPDGHGGSLRALVRSGAVARMEELGIDALSYFQVDNPLIKVIDPAFIGFHVKTGSEMSSKMVPKAYAGEKVGHFCKDGKRTVVIEYSDLPVEMQEETDAAGNLRFLAGSIAIHILDRNFVKRAGGGDPQYALPFHRADKKIPVLQADGSTVKPDRPNGVKFEMFVFDALPFAKSPVIIETDRLEDFSPVKNAEGLDSPETCRTDQLRMWARWMLAAGIDIATDDQGRPAITFEVSPAYADHASTFAESWNALPEKPAITDGLVIA